MKTKYLNWLWLLLPLLLLVFFFFRPKSHPVETYLLRSQAMTEAVYASGSLRPKKEYKIFAMADGILTGKLGSEGDEIKAGQVLFVINNSQQSIRLGNAQEIYALAGQNYGLNSPILRELEIGISNAQTQMRNDSVNYMRFKNLREANATSAVEYDKYQLMYETSHNNYQMQKVRYEKTKNELLLNLQNAQSQVRLNAEQNGDYLVKSLIEGQIFEIYKEQGEAVRRGEAIALVGAKEEIYLHLEIDELDIDKIKIGQEVLVNIDVYEGKVFKAKITKVYRMLNKQNRSFEAEAEFIEDAPTRYAGLTAEANIIIQHKPRALALPVSYLLPGDSVWIWSEKGNRKVKIKKGIENYEWAEVIEGLKEGTRLSK